MAQFEWVHAAWLGTRKARKPELEVNHGAV